ncbi:hypothetical protein V3C33_15690 [Micrococcaceae bacterium Sec5.7]
MAGYFELVDAPDGGYRIRLLDGSGALMAISITFPTKRAAVAGVARAREIAGTGLIRDHSRGGQAAPVQKHTKPARKKTVSNAARSPAPAGRQRAAANH